MGSSFIHRLGKLVKADEAFEAWMSADLDRMVRALDVDTNPIDRHFLLQGIVKEAYRRRDDPTMRRLCREVGAMHLREFSKLAAPLAADMGAQLPNIPSFKWLAAVLAEDGDYESAASVCREALRLGVRDGTKTGYAGRLKRLEARAVKRNEPDAARADERTAFGRSDDLPLADAVRQHLLAKARSTRVTDSCVAADEHFLKRFIEHCGATRRLCEIDTRTVRQFVEWLRGLPGRRSGTLDDATIRHHLNAISNMYRRARAEGWAPKGHDPVRDLLDKPTGNLDEPLWLEVSEAALYLAAAQKCSPGPATTGQPPVPFGYELIATFLLTGGRHDEVLGLEISDVDLRRKTLTFRANKWRRLKTAKSHRTVPLWPQLAQILRAYLAGPNAPRGRLLFPSYRTGEERILTDIRKLLDRVTERVGTLYLIDRGARRTAEPCEIRTKVFRHTYITARLQTLDRGAPVSPWTVAREWGTAAPG